MYLLFEEKKPLPATARKGYQLFAAAGFLNFLSYAFAYTALSMERVSLISPLINGSSLFVLPLSALLLKDVEKLTPRKIGATRAGDHRRVFDFLGEDVMREMDLRNGGIAVRQCTVGPRSSSLPPGRLESVFLGG